MIKKPAGFQPVHIILLVTALLRLPYVFTASYTHDELSALLHLDGQGFKGMWQYVLNDYHPPLVQFFLFGYTRVFGNTEWLIKLPFALCGIWAVWIVYKTGKTFFNEPAALCTAAFMAAGQVFVYHSNVARPYAPGLLFMALFMRSWLSILLHNDRSLKTKLAYVVFAVLAAATHYFAGITAGVAGMLGLLLVKRQNLVTYLVVNVCVVVLMLPVLYVMKVQLSHGGLSGWLGAPEEGFAWKFIFYHFHYSWVFLLVTVLLLGAGAYRTIQKKTARYSPHLVMAGVYLLIFLTAYLYSIYVSPVMQFSIMYFALPFVLLPLFSLVSSLLQPKTIAACLLITGVFSLYYNRGQHQLTADYPYQSFARFCAPYVHNKDVLIVTSDRPEFLARYMDTTGIVSTYGKENPQHLVLHAIQTKQPRVVISGNNDFIPYSLLRSYYPNVLASKEGFLNHFFVLSETASASSTERETGAISLPVARQNANPDSAAPFFNILDTTLAALQLHNHTQFWFRAQVQSVNDNPGILVFELHLENEMKFWYGSELFVRTDSTGTHNCFATYDAMREIRKLDPDKTRVKIYIWNNRLLKSRFTKIELGFMQPNLKYYGLTENIYP